MIYDYALVSYYTCIADATAYSALGLNFVSRRTRKKTVPRFVLSWISHFIKSENREIHCIRTRAYSYRIGSIGEKTRFVPTLFDFERTREIYALAVPSVCNKETKTRRQYIDISCKISYLEEGERTDNNDGIVDKWENGKIGFVDYRLSFFSNSIIINRSNPCIFHGALYQLMTGETAR